ncbi:MAG: pyridoxamine 5'-phosphate oxidase [Actinomycetota bacterium]|nr:pyridoxamine 5'-phosphate oxidase [Actinomycetota bacterium]
MSSRPGQPDRALDHADLDPDPIVQFGRWFDQAAAVSDMPEAMTLATVDGNGRPDARMVLLKAAGPDGFRFYTNYEGVKAGQLDASPVAALVFHWPVLDRQVRVRGPVKKVSSRESDAYFATRDRASQIGAWASPQSRQLDSGRTELDELAREVEERFSETESIPRPPHWGGFVVEPAEIEFWQGRRARLHDRFRYRRDEAGWLISRLAP